MIKSFFLMSMILTATIGIAQCSIGETVKNQLIDEWEMAKVLTNSYMNLMPADKYNFKAEDSIRSFAQQMLHLAQVSNAMISNGTGVPRIFSPLRRLEKSLGAQTKDSVIYYVNASYDFAINAIKKLDPSKLEEKVKERTLELTRFAWLMKAFAHQVHHRGQTAIYIRLVGIKPPNWLE
jgi:uncharacterized damage-inducible protein DinB